MIHTNIHRSFFNSVFVVFIITCTLTLCLGLYHKKIDFCLLFGNLLKPTGHVMHQQFSIQQLDFLPTLYLCVLYLSENKQRLVTLTA